MAEGIYGEPNEYNAGLDFDYSVWTAGTKLDLVNVNWNNDFRDVWFPDGGRTELDAFIDERAETGITLTQLSYVKPGQDVYLPIPYNKINKYNYLRASNPTMPIPEDQQKNYYYFILECEMIAPNNTRLRLQLDTWQTYVYDLTFGNCYVERGHIGIANENAFNNYGRDYLTVPEGLDIGGEYRVIDVKNTWVMTPTPASPPGQSNRYPNFDVLVISTIDLLADPGTVDDPTLVTASGTVFQNTIQGASFYIFKPDQFYAFMANAAEYPWITQGIVSVTMIPKMTRYHPDFDYSDLPSFGVEATCNFPETRTYDTHINWRNAASINDNIDERYQHLDKLKTYPYMAIEMTTFNATPVILKPESWNNPNARILERCSLLPPGQRIEFSPRFYNSVRVSEAHLDDLYPGFPAYEGVKGDDFGEYTDLVTQIANFPTMSVVNNGQIGYLAANVHGIAFQRQSADWTQQRALGSAQAQYGIGIGGIMAAQRQNEINVGADVAQTGNLNRTQAAQAIVNSLNSGIGGVGSALTPAGFVGSAVTGISNGAANAVNAGIQIAANDEALAIRNAQANQSVQNQTNQSRLMNDTNKNLADWAAKGDYANQIAGINAKVQDAELIQPSTSGQIGGESMNMINEGWRVSLRWKLIDAAAVRTVGEIWLRYGYAIRSFIQMPSSLKVMSKFTYWKLSETYIVNANVPEGFKQVIRGIMEKGVTVWTDPNDIGNIDIADNEPLAGVSY